MVNICCIFSHVMRKVSFEMDTKSHSVGCLCFIALSVRLQFSSYEIQAITLPFYTAPAIATPINSMSCESIGKKEWKNNHHHRHYHAYIHSRTHTSNGTENWLPVLALLSFCFCRSLSLTLANGFSLASHICFPLSVPYGS